MNIFRIFATLALALAVGALHADPSPAAPAQAFVPGLGEIMALQQMRHAKLWLAGSAGNWSLAQYELDELREGFEDAARYYPAHEGVPVAAMVNSLTPAPIAALAKAIEGKHRTQFAKAFDQLSATCNTCHEAAGKGFIRIVRPDGSAFPNQDFKPAQKR